MGFFNIFKAELYKIVKNKSLLKILIAVIIIFILASVLYSFLYELIGDLSIASAGGEVTQDAIDAAQAEYEAYKTGVYDNMNAMQKAHDTTLYSLKSTVAIYKYMYENNLSFSSISLFGGGLALSANNYIEFILDIMTLVVTIFAAVTIVKSIAGERANGTLKMQLLRPVKKEEMYGAKILATWCVSAGILLFTTIVSCIVGICAFNVSASDVLVVINGDTVGLIKPIVEILIYFIYSLMMLTTYVLLGGFLSNVMRKSESAVIAITMVMLLIGDTIEGFLGYIFVGFAGINVNLAWIRGLSLNGPALNYMSIYTMIPITLFWQALMLVSSLFMFKKLEINN